MTLQINRKLFTVEEYHRLVEEGIIKLGDRVELINGDIIIMSPVNSNHAGTVAAMLRLLFKQVSEEWVILCQSPIIIPTKSEPEPDLIIAKFSPDSYRSAHPEPADIKLLIEVSESTLVYDQTIKSQLYANANIPEYWIINLVDQQVEIHRQPKNGEYHFKQIISEPSTINATAIACSINFTEIFPSE